MVFEVYTTYDYSFHYNPGYNVKLPPSVYDEVAYQRMEEITNKGAAGIIQRTDSDEIYYESAYSPRLPNISIKTHSDYVAYNDSIKHYKMLNDKKEMKENCILFYLKEMFCCR